MNDALTEVCDVRGDLASLLQPRPSIPKLPVHGKGFGKAPHTGKGKGKGGGSPPSGKGRQPNQWILHFQDPAKGKRILCRGYSSKEGCRFENCKFEHLCPVPGSDGKPCLGKHPAYLHRNTANGLCDVSATTDASDVRKGRSDGAVTSSQALESADFSFETCLSVLQQECSGQATLLRASVLGQGAQASYFNFVSRSSLGGLCQRTLQQPNFVRYINHFLQHVFPVGCWSSFCVSHNEFAHVHQDQNLAGSLNYSISLGAFDGGCVWVQRSQDDFPELPLVPPPDAAADQSLRGKLISTRRKGLTFDGHRLHCSAPWTGDRWVLTAYTSNNWSKLEESDFIQLQSLDFPLPAIAPLSPTPPAISDSAASNGTEQESCRAMQNAKRRHLTQGFLACLLHLFLPRPRRLKVTSSWSCVAGQTGHYPKPSWLQVCLSYQLTS